MGRRRLRPRVRAGNQTLPERGEPAGRRVASLAPLYCRHTMRRLHSATAALLATLLSLTGASLAALDWPQYLGEGRDGVYKGPPLADAWPAGGPRVLWKKPVGQGFSGPGGGRRQAHPPPSRRRGGSGRGDGHQDRRHRSGATPTPPTTATTSASTKARGRCRSSPTASSTPSAPRVSCTPSAWPTARSAGARTRPRATRWRRASSVPPDPRWSKTDA